MNTTGQKTGWLAALFLATGVATAHEINYGVHRNQILQSARETHPVGMKILDVLIAATRAKPSQVEIYQFQHSKRQRCSRHLCALCEEEEIRVLLELYRSLGVLILPKDGELTIVFKPQLTARR
jgi:hypothetical protein